MRSGYTGKVLGRKKGTNIDKNQNRIDLEHITSVKEIETEVLLTK